MDRGPTSPGSQFIWRKRWILGRGTKKGRDQVGRGGKLLSSGDTKIGRESGTGTRVSAFESNPPLSWETGEAVQKEARISPGVGGGRRGVKAFFSAPSQGGISRAMEGSRTSEPRKASAGGAGLRYGGSHCVRVDAARVLGYLASSGAHQNTT